MLINRIIASIFVCFISEWRYASTASMNYTDIACVFDKKDMCGYRNLADQPGQPRWMIGQAKPDSSGSQPAEPPNAQYFIQTGPTDVAESHGKMALLATSRILVTDANKCIYFSYHNRAPFTMVPTLDIRIRQTSGNSTDDKVLAEYFQTNTSRWFEARVPLPFGEYRVIFGGKNFYNGTTSGGLIAVTNIVIQDGDCAETILAEMKVPGDCGFEDGTSMCGYRYTNDSTTTLLQIRTECLPPPEQQQQRQLPADTFFVMNHQFHQIAQHYSLARLQSPELHIDSEGCLYMWYFNNVLSTGEDENALNVHKYNKNGKESILFRLPVQQSYRDKWYRLTGALPGGRYSLIIETVYSNDYGENTYVGFDNIEIFNRSCSETESLPDACSIAMANNRSTCLNGGTCTSLGKKSFRCTCVDGFYGDQCNFNYPCTQIPCDNGATCLNDGRTKMKCICASGFTGLFCRRRITNCRSPEHLVPNARIKMFLGTKIQRLAEYECLDGYFATDQIVSVCQSDGNWSSSNGQCLPFECGPPPANVSGGGKLVRLTNTTLNGEAQYECDEGFEPHNGLSVVRCMSIPGPERRWNGKMFVVTGQWRRSDLGERVQCDRLPRCGKENLPRLDNVNLINITSEFLNGTAVFRCTHGFRLNSSNIQGQLMCMADGNWKNTDSFQCVSKTDCGMPQNITGGRLIHLSNTTEYGVAEYRCDIGYRMAGESKAICWRTSSDPREKLMDWMFVPGCRKKCPAKVGRRGNVSAVILEVADCVVNDFLEKVVYTPLMNCSNSASYAVARKRGQKPQNVAIDSIVFYGSELCIGEYSRRLLRFVEYHDERLISDETKCKSFCLRYPSDIQYFTMYEEVTSSRDKVETRNGTYPHYSFKMVTSSKRTIRKYILRRL